MEQGWPDLAEMQFYEVLRLDPNDATTRDLLQQLKTKKTGR